MRLTRFSAALLAFALIAAACSRSGDDADVGAGEPIGDSSSDDPDDTPEEPRDLGPVFVQHALLGSSRTDGDVVRVTLSGMERTTTWLTTDGAGVLPTGDFIDQQLDQLLEDGLSAQVAIVPSDMSTDPIVLEITSASWEEALRRAVYQGVVPTTRDPRLHDLAPGREARLPREFSASSVFVVPRDPGTAGTTPTTTTTTTGPTTSSTTSTSSTSIPGAGSAPTSTTSTSVVTPPPPTPPSGDAVLVVGPTELSLPNGGGTQTITIRNIGSGVGTWSALAPLSQGISASPTGGLLFPGSATQVTIAYDGTQQPRDFAATVTVRVPNGSVAVRVTVRS